MEREVVGETEGAFAVDLSQFDACEQPGINSALHPQESSSSLKTSQPHVPEFKAASRDIFSFLEILLACLHVNQHTHVGLRDFIQLSLTPVRFDESLTPAARVPRIAQSRPRRSRDLMPCPPPAWRWTGPQKLSPKRRKRRKYLALKNALVQQIICTLNWEALGHVSTPPPSGCIGNGYSDEQWAMVERIDALVSHFASAGSFEASSLGRSADKLERLLHACQELPAVSQDVDRLGVSSVVRDNLDPYGKRTSSNFSPEHFEHFAESQDVKIHVDTVTAKPVVADRIKWNHSPTFDPRPFLTDPIVRAAYEDPDSLRLPEALWVKRPQGKVHCSRKEVIKLAEKWDAKGACKLFPCSEVSPDEAVGIFGVTKDQDWDRLILNPVVINGRMKQYSNYTRSLAPGCMMCLIQLGKEETVRISADDLAEMYYTFKVPDKRARRNCLRLRFHQSEIKHLSCFDPRRHSTDCYVALSALAMGDSLAVEIAQQAHFQVLSQIGGSMKSNEQVCYRKPFPRGPFYEFLAIDDHLGLQVCSREFHRKGLRARDTEVFEQAERAYKVVGLVQHPKKKRRAVSSGIFLGAELDGCLGRVSSPRHRVGLLMLCTAIVARKGKTTKKILSCLVGSWVSVLMYRRPIMSVMSAVFKEGSDLPQDRVFVLSRQARCELMTLSILGPTAQTDLRSDTCPFVFCMDASPYGAGICQAKESKGVVNELWRHSEQRGFYTKLSSPAASLLEELGFSSEPAYGSSEEPVFSQPCFPPPKHLREGFLFDTIELFKGQGNWSKAHAELGFRVHAGLDIHGRSVLFVDLLDRSVYDQLVSLAVRGVIREWHAGPPCFTFGTLRRPRIRSKLRPGGFDVNDPLTREQNSLARRTGFILMLALLHGCFISIEQPGSSVMFGLQIFKSLAMKGCVLSKFCFCSYGSGFKKPSKWLHNKPWLLELESKCSCRTAESHCVIQGSFTHGKIEEFETKCKPSSEVVYGRSPKLGESLASYSASYPLPLVRRMALGSRAHKEGHSVIIPLSRKCQTLSELGCLDADDPMLVRSAERLQPALRPWYEDPDWVSELADSLHFEELLRYKFVKQGHINVLECRTYKTWLKYAAKHYAGCRLLGLIDSRVTLGATAKGRSSSFALSRVLQGSLGYIIGGGLYPGGLHVMSSKNRSDGPSRNRPTPPPSKDVPLWLSSLRKGDFSAFDTHLSSACYAKLPGRWLRLLLLLGGDIERNPGPAQVTRVPRGPFDPRLGFATATASRMEQCFSAFRVWASENFSCSFEELLQNAHGVALSLRGYGRYLYESGHPRYMLVYAITAVQDKFPQYRGFLSPAWQIDKKWQQAEPGECRPVISAPIMRSALVIGLLWNWHQWVAVSMLGFLGMLHPAEFLALRRQDLVLPRDALLEKPILYVHLRNPKTARFARRQHAKIEDALVISYLDTLYGDSPLQAPLFVGSASVYRRQWDAIMDRLQILHSRKTRGATPAVLRGSGATHLYLATEDVTLIAWRGRWTKLKTVEFYLQEVAAQLMLHQLDSLARHRIQFLSGFAAHVLRQSILSLKCSTSKN